MATLNQVNLLKIFQYVWAILSTKDRKRFSILVLYSLVYATLESIGVFSLLPIFIGIFRTDDINPKKIQNLNFFDSFFENHLVLLVTCVIFLITFISFYKIFAIKKILEFVHLMRHKLAKRLFSGYLFWDYEKIRTRGINDLSQNIATEVEKVVEYAITPLLNIIPQILTAVFLFACLLYLSVQITLISIFLVLIVYGGFYFLFDNYIKNLGRRRYHSSQIAFRILSDSLRMISELKYSHSEKYFIDKFEVHSAQHANALAMNQAVGIIPKFLFELIAMISVICFFAFSENKNINQYMPNFFVFSIAAYRLMPCIQQIYYYSGFLKFATTPLENLMVELKNFNSKQRIDCEPLSFSSSIEFSSVTYSYPNSEAESLSNISFEIKKGSRAVIIGESGSGKSTITRILLGLISPTSGKILIDGKELNSNNLSGWQKNLAYVPQDITVINGTIAENIALGKNPEEIDRHLVSECAGIAQVDQFIDGASDEALNCEIGDSGIKLSGGQMQRIALARALYRLPKVLILDEGTSSLDGLTESKIINQIAEKFPYLTLIIVCHRLSMLVETDHILVMSDGKLVENGTYSQLNSIDGGLFKEHLNAHKIDKY
jgi:ATP-binding cassette, subfamily B, bacterial PglK